MIERDWELSEPRCSPGLSGVILPSWSSPDGRAAKTQPPDFVLQGVVHLVAERRWSPHVDLHPQPP